jgi:hypothetical protein
MAFIPLEKYFLRSRLDDYFLFELVVISGMIAGLLIDQS